MCNQYSMMIGRFQPLHLGHIKLARSVLNEGKNVLVCLRDTEISDTDPYSVIERIEMFQKEFCDEIASGKMKIIAIPDIEEVIYGRKVGWGIRQIQLDAETESISATLIRDKTSK